MTTANFVAALMMVNSPPWRGGTRSVTGWSYVRIKPEIADQVRNDEIKCKKQNFPVLFHREVFVYRIIVY